MRTDVPLDRAYRLLHGLVELLQGGGVKIEVISSMVRVLNAQVFARLWSFVAPPELNRFLADDLVHAEVTQAPDGRWSAAGLVLVRRTRSELTGEVVRIVEDLEGSRFAIRYAPSVAVDELRHLLMAHGRSLPPPLPGSPGRRGG